MPFIRNIVIALASGLSVGTLYYIVGSVANSVFPSILPATAGVVGFTSAVAISLSEAEKK